jgi:hypothetical protein
MPADPDVNPAEADDQFMGGEISGPTLLWLLEPTTRVPPTLRLCATRGLGAAADGDDMAR